MYSDIRNQFEITTNKILVFLDVYMYNGFVTFWIVLITIIKYVSMSSKTICFFLFYDDFNTPY